MRRLIELIWLAFAAITAVESFIAYRDSGWNERTFVLIAAFCLSLFMYYFRKKQRLKSERQKRENARY